MNKLYRLIIMLLLSTISIISLSNFSYQYNFNGVINYIALIIIFISILISLIIIFKTKND